MRPRKWEVARPKSRDEAVIRPFQNTLIICFITLFASDAAVAFGYVDGVQVENVRCSGSVISVGDLSYRLIERCGDPDYRETVEIRREAIEVHQPDGQGSVELEIGALETVERWIYRDSGRLTRVLTVRGGVLVDIRLAERD